jgi:hypothetical protein
MQLFRINKIAFAFRFDSCPVNSFSYQEKKMRAALLRRNLPQQQNSSLFRK